MTTSISAEEWRVVAEFPCYEVSDQGRVRNTKTGCMRVPRVSGTTRYQYVLIKAKRQNIHQLVAKAFVPNPEGKPIVDHINGCETDNRAVNLRWVTRSENQQNRKSKRCYKGVWRKNGRWCSFIRMDGIQIYLGSFDDPEEAYHIYCAAAVLYYGDFACG